ncbi:hypothetical protein M8494_36645 [Serratia ureilytica]
MPVHQRCLPDRVPHRGTPNQKPIDAINQLREGLTARRKRVRNHPENGPHPAAGRGTDDPRPNSTPSACC